MTVREDGVKLAVSLWHEITGTVLGNDTSERIKHFLNSRRDDDLAYTRCACAVSTLLRSPHDVSVVSTLTAVGSEGLGTYLRDSPFADSTLEKDQPNSPAIYFCFGSDEAGAEIPFIVVDLCPLSREHYAISRRENQKIVGELLVKASQGRGQYWHGAEEVANEVVTGFDESLFSFPPEFFERIVDNSIGFLKNLGIERYKSLGVNPKRGILLHGDPGTGKTAFCKIVAKRALSEGINIVHFDSSTIRYLDHNFPYMLRQAMKRSPVVIIFDDIDLLCSTRDGKNRDNPFLADLLDALDGIETSAGYVVLAATNHLDRLDPALIRAGRFDIHLALARLSEPDLQRILPVIIGIESIPIDSELLGTLNNLTYADVAEIGRRFKIAFLNSDQSDYVWDGAAFLAISQEYVSERQNVKESKKNANKAIDSDNK